MRQTNKEKDWKVISVIECNENEKIVVNGVTYYKPIEVEEKKKLTGWETPEVGEPAYLLRPDIGIGIDSFRRRTKENIYDNNSINSAALFANKEFSKQYARHETLWRRIAKWQAENDEPICLNKTQMKWAIYFNSSENTIVALCSFSSTAGNTIVFSSEKKCEECIEEFKEELEWDMNEFKWRLDG